MFAILNYKGNQYKVSEDKTYDIDLLNVEEVKENKITFSEVLLISDDANTKVGDPTVKGASIEAEILEEKVLDDKVEVFKFHAKKRYKKTRGHRQAYTRVKILKINS